MGTMCDWLLQGWQNERVLYRDGLAGCVLLVIPTDPAPHLKKVWRAVPSLRPCRLFCPRCACSCCHHLCTCDQAASAQVWDRGLSEAGMAEGRVPWVAGEGDFRAAGRPAGPGAWVADVCAQQGVLDALLLRHSTHHICLCMPAP